MGNWSPLSHSIFDSNDVLSIEKKGDFYMLVGSKLASDTILYKYDERRKMLVSEGGPRTEISYVESTGHIVLLSDSLSEATEFSKLR